MGASIRKDMTSSVTHVVAHSVSGSKYKVGYCPCVYMYMYIHVQCIYSTFTNPHDVHVVMCMYTCKSVHVHYNTLKVVCVSIYRHYTQLYMYSTCTCTCTCTVPLLYIYFNELHTAACTCICTCTCIYNVYVVHESTHTKLFY